jgi:hypothetical protein
MIIPWRGIPPSCLLPFLLLASSACRPATAPVTESPRPEFFHEDVYLANSIQQAREELASLRRSRRWQSSDRKLLLPPLAGELVPATASALNWWLLRFEAGLLPQSSSPPLRSVAEVQAASRQDGSASTEYWLLDTIATHPPRFEVVVVRSGVVLRSREFSLREEDSALPWPLDPAFALARLHVLDARALYVEDGQIFVETAQERMRLSVRDRELVLGKSERNPGEGRSIARLSELEFRREDARLIWSQKVDARGECSEGWSVARQGARMALPLRRSSPAPIRALASWPTSDGERWVLLRESGDVELHRVTMRVAAGARSTTRAAQPSIRVESPRHPLRALGSPMDEAGHRWEFATELAAKSAREALDRRLRALTQQPAWSWLAEPLGEMKIRVRGRELQIEGEAKLVDLQERLVHPLLWLDLPDPAGVGRPAWSWTPEQEPATLRCAWPQAIGDGPPPGDGAATVSVAILPSAAAPEAARRRLAHLLGNRGLPELFAQDAPQWEPTAPVTGRDAREFLSDWTGDDAGPLHLMLEVDATVLGDGERARLLRRLGVLLAEQNVTLSEIAPGEMPHVGPATIVARLTRVSLFSQEPLLRAAELASWCGDRDATDELRAGFAWPRGDPRRLELARVTEQRLVERAAFVLLWRERWSCSMDGRLMETAPWNPALPPRPADLRWHPAAHFPNGDTVSADDSVRVGR